MKGVHGNRSDNNCNQSDMLPSIKTTTRTLLANIVQGLCESQGGRPGLSVLTSLLVSVDVKIY